MVIIKNNYKNHYFSIKYSIYLPKIEFRLIIINKKIKLKSINFLK